MKEGWEIIGMGLMGQLGLMDKKHGRMGLMGQLGLMNKTQRL